MQWTDATSGWEPTISLVAAATRRGWVARLSIDWATVVDRAICWVEVSLMCNRLVVGSSCHCGRCHNYGTRHSNSLCCHTWYNPLQLHYLVTHHMCGYAYLGSQHDTIGHMYHAQQLVVPCNWIVACTTAMSSFNTSSCWAWVWIHIIS